MITIAIESYSTESCSLTNLSMTTKMPHLRWSHLLVLGPYSSKPFITIDLPKCLFNVVTAPA